MDSPAQIFRQHSNKFISIDENTFSAIMSYFQEVSGKKKQNLVIHGQVCKFHYFVASGCLRKFFINGKGVEQTTEFAIEGWWLTDHFSFEQHRPSEFCIQAVENSDLLYIDHPSQEKLLADIPQMERYFRFIYQRGFAASQMRIKYLYDLSKEQMYRNFYRQYHEFVQRIPQRLLASFLGFTPEYLSEIRKRTTS